jgi:hypothetical protein
MNINNQVVQTWDFVARDTSVVEDDSHGMSCLSTITGNIPGTFVGMSPKQMLFCIEVKMLQVNIQLKN